MSPAHAFLILAGITIAALGVGLALALWASRRDGRRRQIAEHTDAHWSARRCTPTSKSPNS